MTIGSLEMAEASDNLPQLYRNLRIPVQTIQSLNSFNILIMPSPPPIGTTAARREKL